MELEMDSSQTPSLWHQPLKINDFDLHYLKNGNNIPVGLQGPGP